jgi:pilus assembly protein CpaF
MFAIIISEKGGAERKEAFDKNEINVGRVQGNDLMLPKGNVSKHHARLLFRDGRFIVTDLKSTNGTYVNGRKIAQATIVREGDKIYIGDFVLRLDGAAAPQPVANDASEVLSPLLQSALQPSAPGTSSPSLVGPQERDADDSEVGIEGGGGHGSLQRMPAPPRIPQGMPVVAAPPTVSPRPGIPFGVTPQVAPQAPSPQNRSHANPSGPPPVPRGTAREAPQIAARRLALITLVDRVAEAMDLAPLKASPLVDDALSQIIDRTVRDNAKFMRAEGEAPEGADIELLVRDAMRELVGFGPVGPLLEDDDVTEIHCVRYDHVLAIRGGVTELAEVSFTSEEALGRTIARLSARSGEPWRPGETVIERRLARGAHMMIGIAPPTSAGYVLAIRKRRRVDMALEDFVRAGALTRAMATFVESCLLGRANVLVCAPRSSGTSPFLSALASAGPSGDRVATVQELDEIGVVAAHVVSLNMPGIVSDPGARGEEAVRAAVGMRPDRIVVTTLTSHVGAATLEAIADGAQGVIAAVQAPSLRQALSKLVTQLVLARPGLSVDSARECVGDSFDIAVELGRLPDERPRVLRLAELEKSDGKGVLGRDVFTFVPEAGGAGDGTFIASGVVPRITSELAARGIKIDPSIFKRAGRP